MKKERRTYSRARTDDLSPFLEIGDVTCFTVLLSTSKKRGEEEEEIERKGGEGQEGRITGGSKPHAISEDAVVYGIVGVVHHDHPIANDDARIVHVHRASILLAC